MSTDSPSGGGVNGERTAISGGGPGKPSAEGWVAGHLDTFHLPGYAVGPLLVTNSDDLYTGV